MIAKVGTKVCDISISLGMLFSNNLYLFITIILFQGLIEIKMLKFEAQVKWKDQESIDSRANENQNEKEYKYILMIC